MAVDVENEQAERKPTERVILKRELVLVLPGEIAPEQVRAIAEVLHDGGKGKAKLPLVAEGWLEQSRKTAATKTAAVEAHAGKPGTPDALVGVFRAPTVTSWKGAVALEAPPEPLVQRTLLD